VNAWAVGPAVAYPRGAVARDPRDVVLDALVEELARVYWEDGRAQVLVLRAGFPSQDLPRFTTPRAFWSLVIWGAAGGEIADGMEVLEAILGGAIEEYPGNDVFRGWERKPEGWELGLQRGVLARVRREIIDFSTERGRHKHFFGREDVLAEMDAWVAERDSGWLLVTGSPGLGKSALMDRWLRRRETAGSLTAFHFIRRSHLDWAEPQVVQRNLVAQIEVMFPEQRDAEAVPTYRLEQLLGRVSPVLAERSERLVLLVDGLDEAMEQGKDNPIPYIVPIEVPGRVFVVAASRPQYPHLGWIDRRTGPRDRLDLDARMVSNEHVVRRYWETLGPQMSPALSAEQQRAAIQGAQGNLLHAVKLHELWSKTSVVRSPDVVPQGLQGMLDELWERIGKLSDEDNARAEDGLSLLCAARESLPLVVVESLLGWRQGSARRKFLPFAREMLLEDAWGGLAYRPFHEGLRELVVRELPDAVRHHHETLAEYAAWPVEGDEFRRSYALRHRVEHRVEAGEVDAAASACMDLGFLTAKACAEGVVAVERDIRLAAEARKDDETRGRLTTLGRLVAASAHWANDVPEALHALLHDRALTNAPEIFGDLVDPIHPPGHPRLRHPLQARGMPRILRGHRQWISALAVLPDGRLVSGSLDGTVRVWDVQTGRTPAILEGDPHGVRTVAGTPEGHVVFDAGETIHVRDVATGAAIASLEGHQEGVVTLVVLPDGRIVSSAADGVVRVWDLHSGSSVTFDVPGVIKAFAVLSSNRLVSGTLDGIVQVWDVETWHPIDTLEGATDEINALAASPDGRIVFGASKGKILMWDAATGALATIDEDQGSVNALAALPNGRLVSATGDSLLRVWDVETRRAVATLRGHQSPLSAVAVLSDGRVVSSSSDATIRVWDIDAEHIAVHPGHQDWVNAVVVLSDGRVVSGSDDRTLRVWDTQTGRLLDTFHDPQLVVKSLAVLPDGRFVSGSWDAKLRVWSTDAPRPMVVRRSHSSWVSALAVLPDGRVVSGSHDHTLRVWDMQAERALATLLGHTNWVSALAVLPDGRVVSGSDDKTLRVWDLETSQTLTTLEGHTGGVRALAVLPDGRVVSGSEDETVRVWDVRTERPLATLEAHTDGVKALAVLPDGRVISGSHDKTLRVWDVQSGRALATVYGDAAFLSVACVDQHLVAAGDAAGNVWFIDLPDLPRT
jgi:WD40 repeat protein